MSHSVGDVNTLVGDESGQQSWFAVNGRVGACRVGKRKKAEAKALPTDGRAARGRASALERDSGSSSRRLGGRARRACRRINRAEPHLGDGSHAVSSATWDAALVQTELSDILGSTSGSIGATASSPAAASEPRVASSPTDTKALTSGLTQLNKYLSRAWYRAGISPQLHDDSSQAVYATLLQKLGRGSFDSLIADVGNSGIKEVFTRETSEGVAFFRAVDMVKKRAQRERIHQSLDSLDLAGPTNEPGDGASRKQALQEAIEHSLSPREACADPRHAHGQNPSRDRRGVGRRPQDSQQRKDPRAPEAADGAG